jgi:hypothetical protein
MTLSNEVMADLQALGGIIARAQTDLAADSLLDLAPLEGLIEDLCRRIESLPAAEGRIVQPRLLALVDDFGRLGRSIEQKMEGLKSQMGDVTERRLAVSAYSKNADPKK